MSVCQSVSIFAVFLNLSLWEFNLGVFLSMSLSVVCLGICGHSIWAFLCLCLCLFLFVWVFVGTQSGPFSVYVSASSCLSGYLWALNLGLSLSMSLPLLVCLGICGHSIWAFLCLCLCLFLVCLGICGHSIWVFLCLCLCLFLFVWVFVGTQSGPFSVYVSASSCLSGYLWALNLGLSLSVSLPLLVCLGICGHSIWVFPCLCLCLFLCVWVFVGTQSGPFSVCVSASSCVSGYLWALNLGLSLSMSLPLLVCLGICGHSIWVFLCLCLCLFLFVWVFVGTHSGSFPVYVSASSCLSGYLWALNLGLSVSVSLPLLVCLGICGHSFWVFPCLCLRLLLFVRLSISLLLLLLLTQSTQSHLPYISGLFEDMPFRVPKVTSAVHRLCLSRWFGC